MTSLVWIVCPLCGAQSLGAAPHGEGQPCPWRLRVDQAYMAKLEAETQAAITAAEANEAARMTSIRSGVNTAEAMEAVRKMIEGEEP